MNFRKRPISRDPLKLDRLQMYKIPPVEKISLQEFEDVAIERLKVLRDVETLSIRHKKDSDEYLIAMRQRVKKFWKYSYSTDDKFLHDKDYLQNVQNELIRDNTSHFILRLAYCKSDELRRWFIAQELDLFRFRFLLEAEKFEQVQAFLDRNNLHYIPISEEEKNKRKNKLAASEYKMTCWSVEATDFYKVPFIEVIDLVRSRKVLLEKGFAFVAKENLVSIIGNCFRMHISHEVAITARALPYLEEDERLLPKLSNLSRQYLGQDDKKAVPGGKVTLGQIDSLSKISFPLCMRQLHEAFRRDHHLKNGGRMQYGLFIKGIGLTLEESLMFWRSEFTRIMEVDKFDKQYAYNIRYNYGKEGKRVNYTPFSCMKIIMSNHPGQGDYHGCVFRDCDENSLRQKLVSYSIPKSAIEEIVKLTKDSHYQLACARYFEVTHRVSLPHADAISHPNKYFDESRRVNEDIAAGKIKQEPLARTSIDHVSHGVGVKVEQVRPTNFITGNESSEADDFDIDMDDFDDDMFKDVADMENLG